MSSMVEPKEPELDVDLLMREIRSEIAGRATPATAADRWSSGHGWSDRISDEFGSTERTTLSRLAESEGVISRKSEYALADFLAFHDEDFVYNAYRAILQREPDADGASRFLALLRTGAMAKVEMLGRMRFSPEGRAVAVPVSGLMIPFGVRMLRRIPVLGNVLGIIQYFFRLPGIVRNLERLEGVVFFHRLESIRGINSIEAEIEAALQRIQKRNADGLRATEARLAGVESKIEALEAIERRTADR